MVERQRGGDKDCERDGVPGGESLIFKYILRRMSQISVWLIVTTKYL